MEIETRKQVFFQKYCEKIAANVKYNFSRGYKCLLTFDKEVGHRFAPMINMTYAIEKAL